VDVTNTPLTITLATDHPNEQQAQEQLLRLLERYNLRRWQFTDAVRIQTHVVPHSHPVLTLNTRHLDDDDHALATYIHEQLHWFASTREQGTWAAFSELQQRFPTVPTADEGGAHDEFSTYLHLIICSLEYESLIEILGQDVALRTLKGTDIYSWVYATLLADWDYFSDLLVRHDLTMSGE